MIAMLIILKVSSRGLRLFCVSATAKKYLKMCLQNVSMQHAKSQCDEPSVMNYYRCRLVGWLMRYGFIYFWAKISRVLSLDSQFSACTVHATQGPILADNRYSITL
jgi:hypothetical protein